VETLLDGKSRDLSFDASGKLLEVEKEVDINSIPAPVKAALERRLAGGTIRKVESVTAGSSISYEASVTTKAGKHTEIAVNPDGTPHRN
jgi:CRISPR/Cas system CSM-associated protein Csm3 (group 7 of RAMP superfamily)